MIEAEKQLLIQKCKALLICTALLFLSKELFSYLGENRLIPIGTFYLYVIFTLLIVLETIFLVMYLFFFYRYLKRYQDQRLIKRVPFLQTLIIISGVLQIVAAFVTLIKIFILIILEVNMTHTFENIGYQIRFVELFVNLFYFIFALLYFYRGHFSKKGYLYGYLIIFFISAMGKYLSVVIPDSIWQVIHFAGLALLALYLLHEQSSLKIEQVNLKEFK